MPWRPHSDSLRLSGAGIEPAHPPIAIDVNGQAVEALEGESVAAALAAAGITTLGRTPAGQPRGVYCGMGVCYECRVTIDGRPGERACLAMVKPGMHIVTENQAVETVSLPTGLPESRAERCNVLVIGAGPAGLAAAGAASALGAQVVVLDERPASGGQYFKPLASSHRFTAEKPSDVQFADGAKLVSLVLERDVRICNRTLVWDVQVEAHGGVVVRALDENGPIAWTADKLIVACGAYERS